MFTQFWWTNKCWCCVFKRKNEQCIFASPFGNIPFNAGENYFEHLLISNAFGTESSGALLGVEEEQNKIVFSYCFISNTYSFEVFKTALRNFVNLAEEWQNKPKDLSVKKFCPWEPELLWYISYFNHINITITKK